MSNDSFLVVLVDDDIDYSKTEIEERELKSIGGKIIKVHCENEAEVIEACKDADVITTDMMRLTRNVFESLPNLKAVIRRGVGFDVIDVQAAKDCGVVVINIPSFCIDEVSNQVILFLLMIAKKAMIMGNLTKSGKWEEALKHLKPMKPIYGETLGIIGLGRLGQAVARKAKALGMHVIAYDAYLPEKVYESVGVEKVELDDLLSRADYVSLHVALTPETRHMINKETLAKMKPTATLINTSRGAVVDEADLIEALQNGVIAAAGLDVFEKEPVDADNLLLKMDNVVVMPHTANYSDEAGKNLQMICAQEEMRIASGSMPQSCVNKGVVPRFSLRPYEG